MSTDKTQLASAWNQLAATTYAQAVGRLQKRLVQLERDGDLDWDTTSRWIQAAEKGELPVDGLLAGDADARSLATVKMAERRGDRSSILAAGRVAALLAETASAPLTTADAKKLDARATEIAKERGIPYAQALLAASAEREKGNG